MVFDVRLGLRIPHIFFGENRFAIRLQGQFAVFRDGHLAVAGAKVETNAPPFPVQFDRAARAVVFSGKIRFAIDMDDLHLMLVRLVAPEFRVKTADTRIGVAGRQIADQFLRAENRHFPAAELPQQEFQNAFDVEIVRARTRIVHREDTRRETGDAILVAFDGDDKRNRLARGVDFRQKRAVRQDGGPEIRIQNRDGLRSYQFEQFFHGRFPFAVDLYLY